MALDLRPSVVEDDMTVVFADQERLAGRGHSYRAEAFTTRLPPEDAHRTPVLAVAVTLSRNGEPWRHVPVVVDTVQVMGRCGGERLGLEPVPDARQYGNTQKAGGSWVVYRTRVARPWLGQPLRLSVHSWLPRDVVLETRAWLLRSWWTECARPLGDGYYADSPS